MNETLELLYNNLLQLPQKSGAKCFLESLHGAEQSWFLSRLIEDYPGPIIIVTPDVATAYRLREECQFFLTEEDPPPILLFPDSETLPYDHFSPHDDLISDRLLALYRLPNLKKGVVLVAVKTLMQYLPPLNYLAGNSLVLKCGDKLNQEDFRGKLEKHGYRAVNQVLEHGEFAVRGSLIDLFPMGSDKPYRIDLYDEIVDSIRVFDPETQISTEKIKAIQLLPAKEFPLTKEAIAHFRKAWRAIFDGDPTNSVIYQDIVNGASSPGVEYYLKLFFGELATLTDYLPKNSLVASFADIGVAAEVFIKEVKHRYEELRHDRNKPILNPKEIFLTVDELYGALNAFPQLQIAAEKKGELPDLTIDHRAPQPLARLLEFLRTPSRVLFCVESLGRRESLLGVLKKADIAPTPFANWREFLSSKTKIGIAIAEIEQGGYLESTLLGQEIFVISEAELFGTKVVARRSRQQHKRDIDAIINNLTELSIGAPVVHIEHGVGRYLGLQKLKTGGEEGEFLMLQYADEVKLYVPVTSLHLLRRYNGGTEEHAPLTRLGSKQWEKAKRESMKKVRDVAAELLKIYAERAAKPGFAFSVLEDEYAKFASAFPFEETEDQKSAIAAVINDMTSTRVMDRLICGDVGFGKTEVAMRAAFIAVSSGKQVAILTPTTLLAGQHYNSFVDRFAEWPIKIEMLSRFRVAKAQVAAIEKIKAGEVDIIIGTHKILQPSVVFKDLGLLIIDEEHRFGVKQKEKIKALRPTVDILALTATPIPRTLNMALSGIRDFSLITTPPVGRLAIRTFVEERSNPTLREAVLREILRGGQVYFLHNDITSIEKIHEELKRLIPEARIAVAHGKMHERDLEKVMSDFYHRVFNLLICTTIIESGLDVPTANTIIINRADRFGLAQLHQLRGRVGRSHHQAYAYLLTPPRKLLTSDAEKRLDALASMGDLGAGFVLATHDLEIRGAGELLGEEQSGEITALGFDLYMEYLERAVVALKNGEEIKLDEEPASDVTEIDLEIPAFIPDEYVSDVNVRLTLYKRIANAKDLAALTALQEEMIDRFGLFTFEIKNLFAATEIRLLAEPLNIHKIIAGLKEGRIYFKEQPNIDVAKIISLVQKEPDRYKLKDKTQFAFKKEFKTAEELIDFVKWLLVFCRYVIPGI